MRTNLNVIELLTEDHRTVARLFAKFAETKSAEAKMGLFHELYGELETHSKEEEEIIYPRAQELDGTKEMADQSLADHAEIESMLYHLENTDANLPQWTITLTKLREAVEKHVLEEERDLFPYLRDLLTANELLDMGRELHLTKQRLLRTG